MNKPLGMAERAVIRGIWDRGGLESTLEVVGVKRPKLRIKTELVQPDTVLEALSDLHRGSGGKRTIIVGGALKRARPKVYRKPCDRRKRVPITWQMQFLHGIPDIDSKMDLYRLR